MKRFNTTGTCFPDKHYMVDISERVEIIRGMIEQGDYFCINRGRQYGKTTTIEAVANKLKDEYAIFSISFEGVSSEVFQSTQTVCAYFLKTLLFNVRLGITCLSDDATNILEKAIDGKDSIDDMTFAYTIPMICRANGKAIVIIIDEVDQSSGSESFLKLLGLFRKMYLGREKLPTFQSVIIAGVNDVKNLRLKIRNESEHRSNSPWNIATPFDVDMSLGEEGIEKMLEEYKYDTNAELDTKMIAHQIREYTNGYPFLVSRLCQLMDKQHDWSEYGFLKAEKQLVLEKNTLFDDLNKKLEESPNMRDMIWSILYNGASFTYNFNTKEIETASMFGIIRDEDGKVAISNRIFETVLYEKFVAEDVLAGSKVYCEAQLSKPEFINGSELDVPLILDRFVKSFKEIYGEQPEPFIEKEGRRLFLLFIKPIINGVGNYYIEAETRDGLRSDLIIDYLGHRYIIEMKIWRGDSYNKRGEKQLSDYLQRFGEPTGYMVSFCFNQNKVPGIKEPIQIGDYRLIEALV